MMLARIISTRCFMGAWALTPLAELPSPPESTTPSVQESSPQALPSAAPATSGDPAGPIKPETATVEVDPRQNPRWIARDRRLGRATIGTGVAAGVMTLGLVLTIGVVWSPVCDDGCGSEGTIGPQTATVIVGIFTGASLIALAGTGGAWRTHRRPLRRWQAALTPGGLLFRF